MMAAVAYDGHSAKRIKTAENIEDRNFNQNANYFGHSNSRYSNPNRLERDRSLYVWHQLNAYIKFRLQDSNEPKVDYKVYSPQSLTQLRHSPNVSIGVFTSINCRHNSQTITFVNKYTKNLEDDRVNHVLLITVINPAYPITCDVINQICSPSGKVLRIVIFKKNGVQAMVEFDCVESAKRAKQALHGCDIYSGCCTLRIEYAKPTRLNVYKNDNESYDYTNPTLGKPCDRPALLTEPNAHMMGADARSQSSMTAPHQGGYAPDHHDGYHHDAYGRPPTAGQPYMADPYMQPSDPYRDGRQPPVGLSAAPAPAYGPPPGAAPLIGGGPPPPQGAPQQGAVMMVYGLDHEKMNCDRMFNLFCLFGNVVRVKFLKSKEGCAMVQMGDPVAVERCLNALNNVTFFNHKMQLSYSKQAFLNDVQQPFDLIDNTPSFKDFMGNRNNRFTNPEAASKNRISPPAKVLHFFNAPHGVTEDDIMNIFKNNSTVIPSAVKFFQSKTERSSSGLIQFESVAEAMEALVLCNHVSIPNPSGKFPFVFKLCFSSTGSRF